MTSKGIAEREYAEQYRLLHKERLLEYSRQYYHKHKLEYAEHSRRYWQSHKAELKEKHRRRWQALKIEILNHYSGGKLACVKCGFNDIRALSIDHIKGDGAKHRRVEGAGSAVWHWLKRSDYPEGYQTLCMNCPFIKKMENREFRK